MELQQFEQAILKLAFETDARITTASVAYYLGIPSRKANDLLNGLLEEGALELDSDPSGNLFYRVPNHARDDQAMGDLKQLRTSNDSTSSPQGQVEQQERSTQQDRTPGPAESAYFNATVEDDDVEPFSPVASAAGSVESRPEPQPHDEGAFGKTWGSSRGTKSGGDTWGGFDDYYGQGSGIDGTAAGKPAAGHRPGWTSIATRVASPDASLDRCGSSPVVVSTRVRCEPKPLPESKPMIVSCSDAMTTDRGGEHSWFGRPSESTALVEAGETALARDYYIEQPEHQPGMALLLSLILCGTGQIYNGEVSKGIMMMVLCFLLWFVLLGWVVHIWSIVDAVIVAERLNRKQN